jgi:cell wall assembly regulator SMI1
MRSLDFREHQPPVSPEALAAAEAGLAELGHRIPPSYREFLAEHDGGPPVQDMFDYTDRDGGQEQDRVHFFLGVADSPDGDLVETAQALRGRVIPGLLPIAGDPFGNFLLLDTRDESDGPIWLWDHEFEPDELDESNLSFVARDLAALLEGLRPAPAQPPPPTKQAGGLKRLFGRR